MLAQNLYDLHQSILDFASKAATHDPAAKADAKSTQRGQKFLDTYKSTIDEKLADLLRSIDDAQQSITECSRYLQRRDAGKMATTQSTADQDAASVARVNAKLLSVIERSTAFAGP